MTKAVWGAGIRLAGAVVLVLASVSCGDLTREGQSSSFLIITSLEGASGAEPTLFGGTLASDVITVKDGSAGVFSDVGKATFRLGLKDPGPASSPTTPTQNNFITIDRYHVEFVRSDGRNTQGVDVPYAFDSAVTATIAADAEVGFTIVRTQAKEEAPLRALASNNLIFSTIAAVTFYGHDQTGRQVSVTGHIGVTFANFGDPQ